MPFNEFSRIWITLAALAIPAVADPALFHQIRNKDTVAVVLPNGECDTKVVRRKLDQITLKLKRKTAACGERNALVEVSVPDVRDVVTNRRGSHDDPSQTARCAGVLTASIGAPVAFVVGAKTESSGAVWAVLLGSAVGASFVCRQKGSDYTIFAGQIVAQPFLKKN
jgi:hypothetical protein